jgi:hypothetical protein
MGSERVVEGKRGGEIVPSSFSWILETAQRTMQAGSPGRPAISKLPDSAIITPGVRGRSTDVYNFLQFLQTCGQDAYLILRVRGNIRVAAPIHGFLTSIDTYIDRPHLGTGDGVDSIIGDWTKITPFKRDILEIMEEIKAISLLRKCHRVAAKQRPPRESAGQTQLATLLDGAIISEMARNMEGWICQYWGFLFFDET